MLFVKEAKWSDVVRVVSGGSFLEVRRLFVREKARGKRREGNGLFNFLNSPRLQWVVWLIGPSSIMHAMLVCLVGLLRASDQDGSCLKSWQKSLTAPIIPAGDPFFIPHSSCSIQLDCSPCMRAACSMFIIHFVSNLAFLHRAACKDPKLRHPSRTIR